MWTGTNIFPFTFTPQPLPVADENPVLQGFGPVECSSCTDLSVQPVWIADVNCYYRDLGVDPRATRKELRLAYQAKDGQSSERLTYVFKQLLDPEVRRAYDLVPLGEVFMDEYVRSALNRKVKDQMSQRMADLARLGVPMEAVNTEDLERDLYAQMGYIPDPGQEVSDTPGASVDGESSMAEDDPRPAKFDYAFYVWRTALRPDAFTTDTLARWQQFLVSALHEEGVVMKFAVGFHGLDHPWLSAQVGYREVFLLKVGTEPSAPLAADVARQVRKDREAAA